MKVTTLLQAKIVCVLYKGTEKLHILDKKDFYGNIIQNIEDVVMFVKRHINIEYRIKNLRREQERHGVKSLFLTVN